MAYIWTYIVLGRLDEVTHDGEEEGLGDGGEQPLVEARTTEDSSSDDWWLSWYQDGHRTPAPM